MSVFTGKTGYIVWPQGETGVHTCRVYDSLDEAVGAARSKADFYHRAYVVRTAYESSSVFIVITLGVIAILCVLMLLGVFVCIFDHDDKNDKSSKE